MAKKPIRSRPMPPEEIGTMVKDYPLCVMPALDLTEWCLKTFLNPDSKLHNLDHFHLFDALHEGNIGFLWSITGYVKQQRQIIGLTEQANFGRSGYWSKLRQEQQMMEWFGIDIPDFIITLDANYCHRCTDEEFCALVEHEMYHITQKFDPFGTPVFVKETGRPSLCIKGHDVEEFIGVVRRYGVGNPQGNLAQMVDAAKRKPEIARVDIAAACGTCLKLVA